MTSKNRKNAQIELRHIQLELVSDRTQHMRSFVDQYYCYKHGYVNRNGKAKWDALVWGDKETISKGASSTRNRKSVVKEHVIPMKRIIEELRKLPNYDIEAIASCLDRYIFFATITKEEDKKLGELKLTSSMPPEYDDAHHDWYQNPIARYLKAGIEIDQYSHNYTDWIQKTTKSN